MKKLNLALTTIMDVYENCGFFEVRYNKGVAVEFLFSYNNGKNRIVSYPSLFKSCIEKNTGYDFTHIFTKNIFLKHDDCVDSIQFNDTIWESELKLHCFDKWNKLEKVIRGGQHS